MPLILLKDRRCGIGSYLEDSDACHAGLDCSFGPMALVALFNDPYKYPALVGTDAARIPSSTF
jgi:hypothetical protein